MTGQDRIAGTSSRRARRAGAAAAALAALVLGIGLGAGQARAGGRIFFIGDDDGSYNPDPEGSAVRGLLLSANVFEAVLRVNDLRLVQQRERALRRADQDFRRGDDDRAARQYDRALRVDDRRVLSLGIQPAPRRGSYVRRNTYVRRGYRRCR